MPVLRPSPSDYTTMVKALANAGAAVSNTQGSRPASKGSVAFVNTSFASSLIRLSSFLTVGPTRNPIVQSGPVNYTVYQTSLISNITNIWHRAIGRDVSGNLYYRSLADYKIYKVAPNGTQTFLAGNGVINSNYIAGLGAAAQFSNNMLNMVCDSLNNLYLLNDRINDYYILKIEPNGNVTSYAGTGIGGYNNGPAATATFTFPSAIAIDASNTLYVAEYSRTTIRKITSSGQVSTLTFSAAFNTQFYSIAVDSTGVIYALDYNLDRVYKITPTGPTTADIALLAGSTTGYANGQGSAAQFNVSQDSGICVDAFGNVYVGDTNNGSIRKISPSGNVITIFGNGTNGTSDTTTQLISPGKPVIDSNGILYISTSSSLRKITPVS